MDNREQLLLEMKRKAGLATAAEIEVLDRAMVLRGDGVPGPDGVLGYLVAHKPAATLAEWARNIEAGVYGPQEYPLLSAGFTLAGEPPKDFRNDDKS